MSVRVLYFARSRELVGKQQEDITLEQVEAHMKKGAEDAAVSSSSSSSSSSSDSDAATTTSASESKPESSSSAAVAPAASSFPSSSVPTVSSLLHYLLSLYPSLSELVPCAMLALNQEYVSPDSSQLLRDGDELAFIQPISGGAWTASLHLLRHPTPELQYFAASTLYTKAKQDWTLLPSSPSAVSASAATPLTPGGLTAAEQQQLMNSLMQELKQKCEETTGGGNASGPAASVLSKLSLALALMASKTPQGPSDLLTSLTGLVTPSTPFPSPTYSLLLQLLTALGEEVSTLQVSFVRSEEIKSQLRQQADAVTNMLAGMMQAAVQQQQQGGGAQSEQVSSLLSHSLSVLLSWHSYGLDLSTLYSSGLWSALLELMATWMRTPLTDALFSSRLSLLSRATELVEKVVGETSYPRAATRTPAVEMMLNMLLRAAKPVYEGLVQQCLQARGNASLSTAQHALLDQADDLCLLICRLSAVLGETESDYLACMEGSDDFPQLSPGGAHHVLSPDSASSPSSSPPPNPLHLEYFQFHLTLGSHPYHLTLVETSLDTWICLQDQPLAERKFEWLKRDVFVQLLGVLLQHAAYPSGFRGWDQPLVRAPGQALSPADQYFSTHFLEDPDSFRRFRAMLLETFLSIQALLGAQYVELLGAELEKEAPAGGNSAGGWQRVESILTALIPITNELQMLFEDADESAEVKAKLFHMLQAILNKIFTLAPPLTASEQEATAPPLLLATCCAFVKSYTFLYKFSPSAAASRDILERTISFLLACMPHTQTAEPSSSSRSSSSASRPSPSFSTASPSDTPNTAGVAFRSLCDQKASAHLLISSPALLSQIVAALYNTPGLSERVQPTMKAMWLQGMAALVAFIAYSEETLRAPITLASSPSSSSPNPNLSMATSYLREITNPIFTHLHSLFSQQLPHLHSRSDVSAQEWEGVRSALRSHLTCLSAVLSHLASPVEVEVLQCRSRLWDLVYDAVEANQAVCPSIAYELFSLSWSYLQQAVPLLLPLKDIDSLNMVVSIYASSLNLLYPHELRPLLPRLLSAGLDDLYRHLPLPSVLSLVDSAVSTSTFGNEVNLRDTWNHAISSVYKLTMTNTKADFKSHVELFESFFQLQTAFYEQAPFPYLCGPHNTLTHVLQFAVNILDAFPSQRGVLQRTLAFIEKLLASILPLEGLPEKQELLNMFAQVYSEQGSGLLRQLIVSLCSDPMPPLLDSKVASILFHSQQRFPDLSKTWIEKALFSPYFEASVTAVSEEDRSLFLQLLWPLRSHLHQWKSLWLEWSKVCQRRESMEALLAFQMQPSGKLRGSATQDAAFASL